MKNFIYKVYDNNGVFLGLLKDVAGEPNFTSQINSGAGELTIKLPRSIFNFDEEKIIKHNNIIKVFCHDKDTKENAKKAGLWDVGKWDEMYWDVSSESGINLFTGYISKYTPELNPSSEIVTVTCLGFVTEFDRFLVENASGGTTINYTTVDPSVILKDIIDKYQAQGGSVTYDPLNIETAGTSVSYSFNTEFTKSALDKVIELSPEEFYYLVESNNQLIFKAKNASADHTFGFEKDVISVKPEKSIENIVNRIYFTGAENASGVPLYKKYNRTVSQNENGIFTKKIVDGRITNESTMDLIANNILDRQELPEVRTTLIIRDNNARDGLGYDIETIKPGDTCKIRSTNTVINSKWDSLVWDSDTWDYSFIEILDTVQQIIKVKYQPNFVTLELSTKLPNISRTVDILKKNLDKVHTDKNPSQPLT